MKRKEYVKFASVIRALHSPSTEGEHILKLVMEDIASIFASDNPRFDRERFYRACEPKQEIDPTCVLCEFSEGPHEH